VSHLYVINRYYCFTADRMKSDTGERVEYTKAME